MYKKTFTAFVAALFLGAWTSLALALERVDLKAEAFKDAKGDITITEAGADQRRLELQVSGLEPNGVYSLWFAGEKAGQRSSVGKEATFRTDSAGKATFSTVVSENDILKWDKFQIAYHPDGNPKNLKSALIPLSGDLPEAG